jgi:hypothetical protein
MARPRRTYLAKSARERAQQGKGTPGRRSLRLRLPRLRREAVILGAISLAVVVGVACLAGALLLAKIDRDWASVARVNGHDISREELRSRMTVTKFLAQQRSALVTSVSGFDLTSAEASALQARAAAPLADPVTASREGLIEDELIRQLAAREGVATPSNVDPWTEVADFVSIDVCHKVRYVRFGRPAEGGAAATPTGDWPAASLANLPAATDRLRAELAANTSVETIVAGLHDAGWQVLGVDTVVSAEGVPADPSLELDPSIAAAAVRGSIDQVVGPTTDLYGRVSMGRVLVAPSQMINFSRGLPDEAQKAKLDQNSLQRWADGRALRRALATTLLDRWTKGVEQAHLREIVIGDAPTSATTGPWVELSGLVLDQLGGVNPYSIKGAPAGLDLHGDALAKTLRDLPLAERIGLFRALVDAANATTPDSGHHSGGLEPATKDNLIPEVGKPAFDSKVKSGDILGPITTSAGPQLFLVEARFPGALDERAQAALTDVRADPAPDPLAYTKRFSPADAPLARDGGWRAADEFARTEAVRSALFDTPIGLLSDPFVLDGKLALALVDSRRTATPDARMLDRLSLDGFDAWYASELAKASIWRSDDPLPELRSPTPRPSATLPTMPGVETPNLPVIPGQPAATPVKTDEFGLPVLP